MEVIHSLLQSNKVILFFIALPLVCLKSKKYDSVCLFLNKWNSTGVVLCVLVLLLRAQLGRNGHVFTAVLWSFRRCIVGSTLYAYILLSMDSWV